MKKHLKKVFLISIFILVIVIITVLSIFLYNKYKVNKNINFVYEETSNVQDNIENSKSIDALYINIDDNNTIGVIEIEKIKYKGLIYEGTTMDVLDKGIGHFKNTPIFQGNVCLAGHNYNNTWAKLHTLEKGDTIKYTSILGSKTYSVCEVKAIKETDMSVLDNTQDNMITLITCIRNTPTQRLCVQAIEI